MLATVRLDRQAMIKAEEVQNEWTYRRLTTELDALQAAVSK
jgi:hypothetical protein